MEKLVRETKSLCPSCFKALDAKIVEDGGKIYLRKKCPDHGEFQVMISEHPEYYLPLDRFYFSMMEKSYSQTDFIIRLTGRCNMSCPMCLASANEDVKEPDMTLEQFRELAKDKRIKKFDLMGCEPTLHKDLFEIIKEAKKHGIVALHTNGLKLEDEDFVRKLKEAGVDDVHLQFDTFEDEDSQRIRGEKHVSRKLKIVENLEKAGLSYDLKATVLKGVNDDQLGKILDFGVGKTYAKEIFFLGCRYLGLSRENENKEDIYLMPDEIIDMLEKQTKGKLNRQNIFYFQKIYFFMLRVLNVRKCFYINHYLIRRNQDGTYTPIDRLMDIKKMSGYIDEFVEKKNLLNMAVLYSKFLPLMLNKNAFSLIFDLALMKIMFYLGFTMSKVPKKFILVGFISACDPYTFDASIAKNCGKGEICFDLSNQKDKPAWFPSGAVANVTRDKVKYYESVGGNK